MCELGKISLKILYSSTPDKINNHFIDEFRENDKEIIKYALKTPVKKKFEVWIFYINTDEFYGLVEYYIKPYD